MARIPVAQVPVRPRRDDDHDRRKGIPLWVWPLIPLLLGALALGLSLNRDDEQRAETGAQGNPPAQNTGNQGAGNNTGQTGNGAPLTDMLQVAGSPNAASFAGRPASFVNVPVQSVVGDTGFFVGPSANQQLFVAIDEGAANQGEGRVQVQPGQAVTLSGVIDRLPPLEQAPAEWGLNASNSAQFANQQVYLRANQVVIGQ